MSSFTFHQVPFFCVVGWNRLCQWKAAVEAGKPWVLDPVGCGATAYRLKTCAALVELKPSVVRGNAGEIMALAGASADGVRGVDSTAASSDAVEAAKALAKTTGGVVIATGEVDYVTDGETTLVVKGGHQTLQKVTATGCSLSSLVGAWVAAAPGPRVSAAAACCAFYGACAERAMANGGEKGPGSFSVAFLDALSSVTGAELDAGANISPV